jgi:prepilin-type N-terminal cleavage/methylation domain-containing protein
MMSTGVFIMNIHLPKKKNGFTLIELLVVMTIIAIIATLGITAYLNAMRNTRNTKSISNLNAMQSAFEQYYGVNGQYEGDAGNACTTMGATLQGGTLPTAQTPASPYVSTCTDTGYCVCAPLEGTGGAVKGGNSDANNCTDFNTAVAGTGAFYCVQNKQ